MVIKKDFVLISLILLILGTFVTWLIYFVPSDSDEFLAYYNIACSQFEGSRLAIVSGYDVGCDTFKLQLFGFEYTKSYSYLGLPSSLIYKPFYNIYPYIESHYYYALFLIILFSILLTKSLDLKWEISLIPLMYFPLTFIFLHDSGPIKIAMLTLPILIIFFKKIINSNKNNFSNFFLIILSTLIIVFALEDKSFYLFLLPSFILCAFFVSLHQIKRDIIIINFKKDKLNIKISETLLLQTIFFSALLMIAIFLLFFMSTKYVQKYDLNIPYIGYLYGISPKISFLNQLNYIFLYLFVPISYADRIFEIDKSLFNIKNLLSLLSFLPVIFILFLSIKNNLKKVSAFLFTPIFFLLIVFLLFRSTWSGHHFIFLHLFFLLQLMFFANSNFKNFFKLSMALTLCVISSFVLLNNTTINDRSSNDIGEISNYLRNKNIAKESVINFSSWGGYLQQSIYGDKTQIVTMADPMSEEFANKINALRIDKNRSYILNICNGCTENSIKEIFKYSKKIETIKLNTNTWKIMKITF